MRRFPKLALSLALVLSLGIVGTVGCSSGSSDETDSAAAATESTEKEEDVVLTDDDVTEFDADEQDAEEEDEVEIEDEDESEAEAEETKHVGADGVGFVDIPASWTDFKDVEGGTDLQWCDGTPYTIVTLNVIDLSQVLSEEERADFTIETALNNIAAHLLEEGMDKESLAGAHVTLAGRDAVQIYGMYPEGSVLVVWLVEDDAGNYRYVSAEGTTDTIMDAVSIVENSYAL